MNVILADYATDNLDLERLANLANKLADSKSHLALQHLVPILRYPNEVILNLVLRMCAGPILHPRKLNQLLAESYPPQRRGIKPCGRTIQSIQLSFQFFKATFHIFFPL